jgi:hypothetical protein
LLSLRMDPDLSAAETAYRSSLTIARRQGAGLLAFKAGVSLARLLRDLHRPKEGFEILSACLDKLHGGFGSADARNARILMNDLAVTGR